jgi:hypothetical protein
MSAGNGSKPPGGKLAQATQQAKDAALAEHGQHLALMDGRMARLEALAIQIADAVTPIAGHLERFDALLNAVRVDIAQLYEMGKRD